MSLNESLGIPTVVTFIESKKLRGFVALGLALGIPFLLLSCFGLARLIFLAWESGLNQNQSNLAVIAILGLPFIFYRLYFVLRTACLVLSSIELSDTGFIVTICSGRRFQLIPDDLAAAEIKISPVRKLITTELGNSLLKAVILPTGTFIVKEEWLSRIFEISGLNYAERKE